MNITTRADAIAIIADEVGKHGVQEAISDSEDYANGLIEGLCIGMNFDLTTFFATHGTEQRLRHYARQSLIRQKLMRDPSAPPAGVA